MIQSLGECNFTSAMLDQVCSVVNDLELAEDLQLEEVLRFSAQSGTSCAVCRQAIQPEASWKPDACDHAICIACFGQYAPEAHPMELPKCLVPSCQSLLKPGANGRGIIVVDDDDDDDDILVSIKEIDNGKGKKPSNGMPLERSECSRGAAAAASKGFYCSICMETVHVVECFSITGCTHAFCVSCVRQYVAAKVEENMLSIGCPDPGCKDGALHPEGCRFVLPPQLFQRWGDALCDSALLALKFYCPFSDCSALLVDDPKDGEATITDAECPHCSRMFCAQCKVPWHEGVSCAEFQQLGTDERGREDLLLRKVAQESKWQRCPKCKMYVERAEGCVFIICRCGHCFCYLCASPMSRDNHHCKNCKRTW